MPSPFVHAGFALLIAAALLKGAFDRRALAVILAVLLFPELDTFAGWYLDGAHRALLHNLLIPIVAGGLLYYDIRLREQSWLRARFGDWGVRVAGVALFVHVFAHVLLDYAHLDGVNLFYPLFDSFYRLDGELSLSTSEGIVQTFIEIAEDTETGHQHVDAGQTGTTDTVHVSSPVDPSDDGGEGPPERLFPFAWHGWQLYLIVAGLFTVAAKRLQGDEPEE